MDSFSDCGSCSGESVTEEYLSDEIKTWNTLLPDGSNTNAKLLRIIAMAAANRNTSAGEHHAPAPSAHQVRLLQDPVTAWLSQRPTSSALSPTWTTDIPRHANCDTPSRQEIVTQHDQDSSPYQRRLPHLMPRPAHTAPPCIRDQTEGFQDVSGASGPRTGRRPRSPATKEREVMAKRRARSLQNEAYKMQRIAHAEGRQLSERDVEITPTRTRPSMFASDGFHTPRTEPVKFANPYDTPMCSDWIMEAPTEYEATETLASQAHSPEVVNSTSLQQGTPSCNQYITPEKVRDAWKEGMESRMDFLQTNLTELLHLIKQGISSNHRQPTEILPNVQEVEKTTAVAECILQNPETPPSRVDGTTALSEPENKAGPGDTSEGIDRHRSLYPNTQSPCSGETAILSPIMCTQAEISNSGSSPPLTSPRTSHGTHSPSDAVTETTSNVHTSKVDVQGTRSIAPVSGVVLTGQGILTRGVRGRKAGFCSKAPPEFQPAKDTDTPVPSKKLVWIIHPEHGEVIVASGRTGPGPRSKVVKDGPPCLIGAQWIHVLRVFKHAVGVMHPCPDDDRRTLDCALPPKRGRHELLLWNSRYLIPYKVDESTCTSP